MPKLKAPPRTDNEVRQFVHRYFYDRYRKGRGERGKNGIAAKISTVRKELKAQHGLTQQEIARALTYLIDEGWVRRDEEQKMFHTPRGTMQPATAVFYRITSPGVTKLEGESEFTRPAVHGINITATHQSIVTVGDNNHVDARFEAIGRALVEFEKAVAEADDVDDAAKWQLVNQVKTIESQLATAEPNKTVIGMIWNTIERLTTSTSLAVNITALAPLLAPFLN